MIPLFRLIIAEGDNLESKILQDIASIYSGYSFRKKIVPENDSGIQIIQLKDVKDSGTVDFREALETRIPKIKEEHLLKKEDILFKAKSSNVFSAVVKELPRKTIVAAPLVIIRLKDTASIRPEYVSYFLNQSEAQRYFERESSGAMIKVVSQTTLGNLSIPIPAIEKQNLIAEIQKLKQKEARLLEKIKILRDKYVNTKLLKYIKG